MKFSYYLQYLVCRIFWVILTITLFVNSESFVSSLIFIPFIYFSCLTALAVTYRIILNIGGDSEHLCLFPDDKRAVSNVSPSRMSFDGFFFLKSLMSVDFHQMLFLQLLR